MKWTEQLVERLLATATPAGSWGYRPDAPARPEPSAIACLALRAHDAEPARWTPALTWLASEQQEDGSIPVSAEVDTRTWATRLAVLAWQCTPEAQRPDYLRPTRRATAWLLSVRGERGPVTDEVGHDTRLQGWSWTSPAWDRQSRRQAPHSST